MLFWTWKTACLRAQLLHTAAHPEATVAAIEWWTLQTSIAAGNYQPPSAGGRYPHPPNRLLSRQQQEHGGRASMQNRVDRAVFMGRYPLTRKALVKHGET